MELTLHSELHHFPGLPADRLASLTQSVKERGVLEPLVCTPDHEVYSGRSRWRVAQVLELPKIPVLIRPESDVVGYAIETAIARRQMTRSAIALFLYKQHPDLAATRGAKAGRPKKSVQNVPISEAQSYTKLSERYHVRKEDFGRLATMEAAMVEEEWKELCRLVFDEEKSIATLFAGWSGTQGDLTGGLGATKIFDVTSTGQLELSLGLFPRSIKSLKTCWSMWDQDPRFHGPMLEQWTGMLEDIPDALVPATLKALQRRARK